MEINSFPDLPDELILRAKRHGVVFAVDTDAHAAVHLGHLRYGVGTAQQGWLIADDVINTWPLARLREFTALCRGVEPSGEGEMAGAAVAPPLP